MFVACLLLLEFGHAFKKNKMSSKKEKIIWVIFLFKWDFIHNFFLKLKLNK